MCGCLNLVVAARLEVGKVPTKSVLLDRLCAVM